MASKLISASQPAARHHTRSTVSCPRPARTTQFTPTLCHEGVSGCVMCSYCDCHVYSPQMPPYSEAHCRSLLLDCAVFVVAPSFQPTVDACRAKLAWSIFSVRIYPSFEIWTYAPRLDLRSLNLLRTRRMPGTRIKMTRQRSRIGSFFRLRPVKSNKCGALLITTAQFSRWQIPVEEPRTLHEGLYLQRHFGASGRLALGFQ